MIIEGLEVPVFGQHTAQQNIAWLGWALLPGHGRNEEIMEESMGMKATERQVSDVTILDISGRITLGDGTALFRNTTRDLISQGKKKLLLNLSQVPYIDSSGIAELVSAFVAARREGGDVKLLKLTKKVRDTVEIVHLGSIFELFDDEAAALKAFARKQNQEPDPLARAG